MQSIFAISRQFEKKLELHSDDRLINNQSEIKDMSLESDEYLELASLTDKIKNIDQNKLDQKISIAIQKELQSEGMSDFPDVVQLTIDNDEGGVWYLYDGAYERANEIEEISFDDLKRQIEEYSYNDITEVVNANFSDPDLLVGELNGQQIIFTKQPGKHGSISYKQSRSMVMPVSLTSDTIMRLANKYNTTLKSLGVDLDDDDFYGDLEDTLVSQRDVVLPSFRGPVSVPVEQYTTEELNFIRKIILFTLKSPLVQSSPEYTEALLRLHGKTESLVKGR